MTQISKLEKQTYSYYTTRSGIHKVDDNGKLIWSFTGEEIDHLIRILPIDVSSGFAELLEKPIFSEHVIWLMLDGAKTTGSYLEGLQYHGEEYTHEEYANAENFLKWLVENNLNIGHGNAQEMIDKWLDEVPGKES